MLIGLTGFVEDERGNCGSAGAGKDLVASYLAEHHSFVVVALADPLKRIARDVYDFSDTQLWGPSEERNKPDPRYVHQRVGSLGTTMLGGMDVTSTCYEQFAHLIVDGHLPSPPENEYLSARMVLQRLGTEFGRWCYDNTWVDYALRIYKTLQRNQHYYDVKYGLRSWTSNENAWAKTSVAIPDVRFMNEVKGIKDAGGYVVRVYRPHNVLAGAIATHISETALLDVPDSEFDFVLTNKGSKASLFDQVEDMMKRFERGE